VMEAMAIGTAADLWGDVPYTEIAKYPRIATPKFDSQASVYAAAQVLLDSAIANITLGGNVADEDFFYGGSDVLWKAAAHTVKARLYLHTRDYANAITQAAQGIASAGDNMMAPHGDAYGQTFNLYYSFLTYDRPGYMAANSAYAPTLLDINSPSYRGNSKTIENGRLNYYYAPINTFGGLNTGATYDPNVLVDFDWGNPSAWNGFFGATTSFPILTFQENQLILAEAYMKQATPDPTNALGALNSLRQYYAAGGPFAKTVYYTGTPNWRISSSLTISGADVSGVLYDDYALADFAPGGIDNNGTDDQNTALLREILEERYVTLIGQIEGFNDERRTHNFLGIPTAPGKPNYPERCLYSQIEVNTNPNVPSTGVGLFDKVPSFKTPY